jgi:hypothetical protein
MALVQGSFRRTGNKCGCVWGVPVAPLRNNFFVASLAVDSAKVVSGYSGGGLDEEASLPESAVGSGISSRLMILFGSGAVEEEGLGGTSTSWVTIIEAGEGLIFFFWGLLPLTLLHNEKKHDT